MDQPLPGGIAKIDSRRSILAVDGRGRKRKKEEEKKKKRRKVRGIANSKDSILMQGLVHGRRSVRGYPKVRSELDAIEHQNFLFDMERIPSAFTGSLKGMVVSETSSGKNVKRKVAPTG
ncbi:hypothetical protein GW17_00059892 [Ensete ventricosum]|nr:hypothetical protein GW17_00059892 [Ensete ventricosum]